MSYIYVRICMYVCTYVYAFFLSNGPLTHLDMVPFYAWRHNLSHAWKEKRFQFAFTVELMFQFCRTWNLLWVFVTSSVTGKRLNYLLLQGPTLITLNISKLRWNIFLMLYITLRGTHPAKNHWQSSSYKVLTHYKKVGVQGKIMD